ncbi:efflux RND transporter periplasmic adaptor subunit [Aliamphritea hakodatensis]|uniref:efflux RND transporter periplasmic adaptor subunit n=1 Tax=Aliamphritea hakodatensis TaxID=2895352 RepID=UPI0022FD9525|nr:efflux RND transporter periplasmic adaptor subunit [Aliamphritea hakodatensis]
MKKSVKTQLLITVIAAAGVLGAYAISSNSPEENFPAPLPEAKSYPQVTIIEPAAGNFPSSIKGYGEVIPVQTLNLAAEVSGRVTQLSALFKSGERLQAGDVLLKVDDTEYREAVANAKSALAAAEVTLLQQQLNRTQAKAEWQRSGLKGSPDSELALYAPQVKSARAAVEHARRSLEKANADLGKTIIRAPFNALIVSRAVELGGFIQPGAELAVLYGTDQVELTLPISTKDWSHLPQPSEDEKTWFVSLSDTESDHQWQGYVDRATQHIESNTRQRSLIVRLDNPLDQSPPLYPGTFIEASVPGLIMEDVWQIPASSVTQNNEIWFVDGTDTLIKAPANIRLRMADKVYLASEDTAVIPRIVTLPLASYLPGMKVETDAASGIPAALAQTNASSGSTR